jgi:uncharacterized membrane-anchored protein
LLHPKSDEKEGNMKNNKVKEGTIHNVEIEGWVGDSRYDESGMDPS